MATVSNMILNNNKPKLTSFGAHPDPPLWGYHSSVCQQQKEKSRKKLKLNQIKDSGPKTVLPREKIPPKDLLWALLRMGKEHRRGRMGQDDLSPLQQVTV